MVEQVSTMEPMHGLATMGLSLVGYAAAFLTTFSFVPQAWRILQSRDVSAISPVMYSLFTLGVFFWLLYGLFLHAWPIILANGVTFCLSTFILFMRLNRARKIIRP
jgi:MtN3 and saliva related transmembrane protein